MRKPAAILGTIIIVNACLWGFTILMVAHTLKGAGAREAYDMIQHILGGVAAVSTVIVGGGMAGLMRAMKAREQESQSG
ncbi:MAG: hypothetical protein GF400_10585 [Candidatus Eisenbacteria bacterium]|nr:hypothetical protein [Candidatus Eisenbacteria bacterium]